MKMSAFSVAIADVNGDGEQDLIVASSCPDSAPYYPCSNHSGMVNVLAGNGDGTFQAPVSYYPGGWYPISAAVSDVNADGRPDLLVTSWCGFDNCATSAVGVLLNDFLANTTSAIVSSLNPSFVNQQVTFTATVSSNPPVPDGETVTFYNGPTVLATVPLASGTAACSTSSLPAGSHTIHAKYGGDTWHKPSSGAMQQLVLKYSTTSSLTSNPNPSTYGQAVTFTATVMPSGPYPPSGKVRFFDGATGIGVGILKSGVATLVTSKLAVGTHSITAEYLGDSYNAKSTSPIVNQVVQ